MRRPNGSPVGQSGMHCVLTYHEILPEASSYLYRLTRAQFQEHLSLLSPVASGPSSPGQFPLITFDDGHRSNFDHAFPLLEQFGFKATFFVLAGCLGSKDNHISWDEARQMLAAGHRIESHGWSHRLLTRCNPSELQQELADSKHRLEDCLGREVLALSAPGGRWNARVAEACVRTGYKYLFHSNPWAANETRNGLRIRGRHMITGRVTPSELKKLMQAGAPRRLYSRFKYQAKERVRETLGDRLYHKIWCWVANWNPEDGMEVQVDLLPNRKKSSGRT